MSYPYYTDIEVTEEQYKRLSNIVYKEDEVLINDVLSRVRDKALNDFVIKCKTYYAEHEEIKNLLSNEEPEDYEQIYFQWLTWLGEYVIKCVVEYRYRRTKILNVAFSELNDLYYIKPCQHLTYSNGFIVEGLMSDECPINMTMIVLQDYKQNIKVVDRKMNDDGYVLAKQICLDESDNNIVGLVYVPIDENPFSVYMYNNLDNDDYKYLYFVGPKGITTGEYMENYLRPYSLDIIKYVKYGKKDNDKYIQTMAKHVQWATERDDCQLYMLEVTPELLNTYTFYIDGNSGDYCYASENIEYKYITKVEDIDLNKI